MQEKLLLKDLDVKHKRVLVRVDYNVPLTKEGLVADSKKIQETLPTLNYLLKQDCVIILISHLGKPDGKKEKKYSLRIVTKILEDLLHKKILFIDDCVGDVVKKKLAALKDGEIALLENLRFYPEEENLSLNSDFAKQLASYADVYVDDAFGAAHRAHASNVAICQFFPKKSAMGFLMEKELLELKKIVSSPSRPFFAILGGSKVSSKLKLILTLLDKVDALFIGGAMAFTFFKAERRAIGNSLYEPNLVEEAKQILAKACDKNISLHLPLDLVIAKGTTSSSPFKTISIDEGIPDGWQGVDIGEKTISSWTQEFKKSSTVFWNGPLGICECPDFAKGTSHIALALSHLDATTIVGGGDSAAAISLLGLEKRFTHVSTGGGATLELIEKGTLPAIEALSDTH